VDRDSASATAHDDPGPNYLSPDLSVAVQNCPELADVIRAWPALPADVRKMIAGVVKATVQANTLKQP